MTYRIEEAELTLPAGWRDHTMNVFRLAGAKDASIVVTRDSETPIEDPQEYADKQQAAAREQFAAYKPLGSRRLEVDGRPAFVVDYQWRGSGVALLRQRQAFVRHRGLMLAVTLTALADHFAQHEAAWAEFIGTLKLRDEASPAPAAPAANDEAAAPLEAPPAPAPQAAFLFALHASECVLQVLTPEQNPNEVCNAVDVEDGRWEFFDTAGQPMRWRMLQPNRRMTFQSLPGTFDVLERLPHESAGPPLLQRLDAVPYLKARGALTDLAHVREHLARAAGASAGNAS